MRKKTERGSKGFLFLFFANVYLFGFSFSLILKGFALWQVQTFSAPHFLFLWRVKEKENAPLAVEKKKKSFQQLVDGSVKKDRLRHLC